VSLVHRCEKAETSLGAEGRSDGLGISSLVL